MFQPSAAKWNILGTNDASFNDGTGIFGLKKDLLTTDSNPYKFSAYRNASWTASAGLTKVALDAELFDTNNNFSTTNNRYTIPVSGFYQFNSTVLISGNTSRIFVAFYKNGVTELGRNDTNISNAVPTPFSCALSGFYQLTAGEYVELFHAAAAVSGGTGSNFTYMSGFLVCRT